MEGKLARGLGKYAERRGGSGPGFCEFAPVTVGRKYLASRMGSLLTALFPVRMMGRLSDETPAADWILPGGRLGVDWPIG